MSYDEYIEKYIKLINDIVHSLIRKCVMCKWFSLNDLYCKKMEKSLKNGPVCTSEFEKNCDKYCHSCNYNTTKEVDGLYYHECSLDKKLILNKDNT